MRTLALVTITAASLTAGVTTFAPTQGEALPTFVGCPIPQAKRTIVNPLPGGWWTTPQVNSLSGTELGVIGGTPVLICKYGASGQIQRHMPAGHICVPVPGGFACTPPGGGGGGGGGGTPPFHTYNTGGVSVPQTWQVNFDNGNVGSGAGADLWFHAVTATQLYLEPVNGAQIAVGDRSNRGFAGCRVASFSSGPVPLAAVPVGSYICMKLNTGRISQFRMNNITPGSPKTLSIGYTTWEVGP
jgi:hypothetical protein